MAEETTIQSMALQKRNADSSLMPPPPPKRLKRPPKTLPEEDYTSAITTIIERDFYPQLV
jgi:protein DGCR14